MSFLNLPSPVGDKEQQEAFRILEMQMKREREVAEREAAERLRSSSDSFWGKQTSSSDVGGGLGILMLILWWLYRKVRNGLGNLADSLGISSLFASAEEVVTTTAESVDGPLAVLGNLGGVNWGGISWWDILLSEPVVFLVIIPLLIAVATDIWGKKTVKPANS